MRIRLEMRTGDFRLLERGADIGWLRGDTLVFHGFVDRAGAADAALVAGAALERSRAADDSRGPVATALLTGAGATVVEEAAGYSVLVGEECLAAIRLATGSSEPLWRVEIRLRSSEVPEVFALARARIVWRALRTHGIDSRMAQFGAGAHAGALAG